MACVGEVRQMTLIFMSFASLSSAVGASCVGMDRALARCGLKCALGRNPKQNMLQTVLRAGTAPKDEEEIFYLLADSVLETELATSKASMRLRGGAPRGRNTTISGKRKQRPSVERVDNSPLNKQKKSGIGSSTLALRAKVEQKEAEDELEQENIKQTEPEEQQKTTGKKLEKATAEQREAEKKREESKAEHREASAQEREAEEKLAKAQAAVDGGEGSDGRVEGSKADICGEERVGRESGSGGAGRKEDVEPEETDGLQAADDGGDGDSLNDRANVDMLDGERKENKSANTEIEKPKSGRLEAGNKLEKREAIQNEAEGYEKAKAERKEAEEKFEKAKAELKEAEEKFEKAKAELKEAEEKFEKAKAELKEAEEKLEKAEEGGNSKQIARADANVEMARENVNTARENVNTARENVNTARENVHMARRGVGVALDAVQTAGMVVRQGAAPPPADSIEEDQELLAFWQAMWKAQVGSDNVLDLGEARLVDKDTKMASPGKLYVRNCYKHLSKVIKQASSDKKNVVVSGTPGTGKSAFRNYHVYDLVQDMKAGGDLKTIVLDSVPSGSGLCAVLTVQNGGKTLSARLVPRTQLSKVVNTTDPNVVYLLDVCQGDSKDMFEKFLPGCVVMFTSPNDRAFKEFLKQDVLNRKPVYMPTWKRHESENAAKMAGMDIESYSFNESWRRHGGIARAFLAGLSYEQTLEDALNRMDWSACTRSIRQQDNSGGPSHSILYYVVEEVNGVYDFQNATLTFGTQYILTKAADRYLRAMRDAVESLIHSQWPGVVPHVAGDFLEHVAHRAICWNRDLALRRVNHRARDVVPKKGRHCRLRVDKSPLEWTWFSTAEKAVKLIKVALRERRAAYLRPHDDAFPAVDSILVTETRKVLYLQMTMTDKHPIDGPQASRVFSQLVDATPGKQAALVFVVPKSRYNDFPQQKIPNHKTKTVNQYAVVAEVPSGDFVASQYVTEGSVQGEDDTEEDDTEEDDSEEEDDMDEDDD